MPMDRKRHLEAGGNGSILRRILICEVNNKVWTQGQSKAALRLSCLGRLMWSKSAPSGKWDSFTKHTGEGIQVQRIHISAESTQVATTHIIIYPPTNHPYVHPQHSPNETTLPISL